MFHYKCSHLKKCNPVSWLYLSIIWLCAFTFTFMCVYCGYFSCILCQMPNDWCVIVIISFICPEFILQGNPFKISPIMQSRYMSWKSNGAAFALSLSHFLSPSPPSSSPSLPSSRSPLVLSVSRPLLYLALQSTEESSNCIRQGENRSHPLLCWIWARNMELCRTQNAFP